MIPSAGNIVHNPHVSSENHRRQNPSIYHRLKALLLGDAYCPGQHIDVAVLAESFTTSVTPIRETLIRLAAEDLVAAAPNRGFFCKLPDVANVTETYEFGYSLLESSIVHNAGSWSFTSFSGKAERLDVRTENAEMAAEVVEQVYLDIVEPLANRRMTRALENFVDQTHQLRVFEFRNPEIADREIQRVTAVADYLAANKRKEAIITLKVHRRQRMTRLEPLVDSFLLASLKRLRLKKHSPS